MTLDREQFDQVAARRMGKMGQDGIVRDIMIDPVQLAEGRYPRSFLRALVDPVDGTPFQPSGTIEGHTFKAPNLALSPLLTREQIEQLEREERSVAAD